MSFCSYSKGGAMYDSTPIENMFLLEYLPTAPDGFLRVYLYARMLCAHPELGEGLADMARALRMDEEGVFNALTYWEQQGLVERLTDRPPTYAVLPLRAEASAPANADHDYYTYREYNSSLQEIFGASELLEPKQYKLANDWLNVLGLEQEAALQLLMHAKNMPGGKKAVSVFKRADKLAMEWAERGVKTVEQVRAAIEYDDRVYNLCRRVLQQMGIRRAPSIDEQETVRRWIDQWKLNDEEVIAACRNTTKARFPSIGYLDAILKSRIEGGGLHFDAVKMIIRNMGSSGGAPTPEQQQQYAAWLGRGYDPGVIDLASAQCARNGKHLFSDLEWMLTKWAEMGIRTRAQAEKHMTDIRIATNSMYALLERAGQSRRPTADDLEYYAKWKKSYPHELISCAAEFSRGTKSPVHYMDKLLNEWARAGICDEETARAEHSAFSAAQNRPAKNAALNYQQHTYTESDYVFYDPMQDMPQEDVGQ